MAQAAGCCCFVFCSLPNTAYSIREIVLQHTRLQKREAQQNQTIAPKRKLERPATKSGAWRGVAWRRGQQATGT